MKIFQMFRFAFLVLVFLSSLGCKAGRSDTESVQDVRVLTDLNLNPEKYSGQKVVVTACVFSTQHVVGLMTCDEDTKSMLELKFVDSEQGNRAREIILDAVAKKLFISRAMLPMRATGRFTARRSVGIFELERADFLSEMPCQSDELIRRKRDSPCPKEREVQGESRNPARD